LSLITPHPTPGYLEGIIPTEIGIRYYTIITLNKAVQLEFGRGPLNALQKTGRAATTAARATRAEEVIADKSKKPTTRAITKKTISKKRKAIEIEPAADNESDEIEESEVVYIREIVPKPKRSARLAKKIKA
jgi:hypothetical protein